MKLFLLMLNNLEQKYQINVTLHEFDALKIDSHKVIVLVTNRNSYSKLSSLITLARRRSKKGSYQIKWSDLKFNNDDEIKRYVITTKIN